MTTMTPAASNALPQAWTPLRPHRQQHLLWRTRERIVTVAAGRGSGKTELALRRLALLSRIRDSLLFYGGPTVNQAKRVAWGRLIALVPPQWVTSINQSDLIIKTKFGSEIHVCGMDKPHRIEGTQWNGGVLDEGSDIKPGAFARSVYPALTHKDGWLWRIGVPKRTGIGAREFKQAFDDGVLDKTTFTWPSSTVLPARVIDEARRMLDEKTFAEQFEASWESAEGSIYYAFAESHNVRACHYRPNKRIVVGSDFNVSPMSWVLGHIYEGAKPEDTYFEAFDQVRLRDTNTPATLTHLHARYAEHKAGWAFYGDAASRARKTNAAYTDYQLIVDDPRFDCKSTNALGQEEIIRKRVLYPKKNPMLRDRFAASNTMFKNMAGERRIYIDPKCKDLVRDLVSRSYKEGLMEPDDSCDQGHMADALDYIIFAEFPVGWDRIMSTMAGVHLS